MKTAKKGDDRDYLILRLAAKTGMRSGELYNIQVEDISFEERAIRLKKQKYGNKPKPDDVLLDQDTCDEVDKWVSRNKLEGEDKLWGKICLGHFRHIIKKYGSTCGVDKPISMHTLRHFFATNMAESGATPPQIQSLMRHTEYSTTDLYIASVTNKVHRPAYDKANEGW